MKNSLNETIKNNLLLKRVLKDLSEEINEKVTSKQFTLYKSFKMPYSVEEQPQPTEEMTQEFDKAFNGDYINLHEYFDDCIMYVPKSKVLYICILDDKTNEFVVSFYKKGEKEMNEYKAIILTLDGCTQFEKTIQAENIVECAKQLCKTFPKRCIMSITFNQVC